MLIATSPRLSSDQEKKSTEDACPVEVDCMSSKCNSGTSGGKRGDMTYEEHSRHMPNSQSTYEHLTDRITTKQRKELSDNQRTINAQSSVYYNSIQPTIMQSDIQNHTKQAKESQGEELIYYIQHAEASSEELDSSLETAVQTDDFCNFLQTATVQSEESTQRTLTVQSEALHCSIQSPTAQSKHQTNHLQISTLKSDKSCNMLKTLQSKEPFKSPDIVTVQSEELFTSSHTATVQSEEPFKSLKTAIVQSEELCSSIQMPDVLSVKPFDCLLTENVHSEGPCNSLWTATDQQEELNRPLQTSTVQSEELGHLPNTPSHQSLDLYNSKTTTVQRRDHYNLRQSALDDFYHTGQAVTSHSEVLYPFMQATTAQAKCHHPTKATEDQADGTVNSGQTSPTQSAEAYYVKQASTVESEEIYLSCDIHWNDSVTANKVAVEGDLMTTKIDRHIVDIVQNEEIAFCNP